MSVKQIKFRQRDIGHVFFNDRKQMGNPFIDFSIAMTASHRYWWRGDEFTSNWQLLNDAFSISGTDLFQNVSGKLEPASIKRKGGDETSGILYSSFPFPESNSRINSEALSFLLFSSHSLLLILSLLVLLVLSVPTHGGVNLFFSPSRTLLSTENCTK